MWLILATEITIEGIEEVGVSAIFMLLCLLGIITILCLKFLNVVKVNTFYEKEHIFTTVFVATICYVFVLIHLLTHPTLLFAIYFWGTTFMYMLIWFFFIAEIIFIPVQYMRERKQTRFSR